MLNNAAFASDNDSHFKLPASSDYPAIAKSGEKVSDFLPPHWQIMGQAKGDLNGDKIDDLALVIKGNEARFKQKNDGLGSDLFDTNPRMLLILFKDSNADAYNLVEKSNKIIPIPDSPTMEEPFEKVSIKNGMLQLDFSVFYSAGSWTSSNTSYKFRWQNKTFVLIGADSGETQRNTGETNAYSYNFLTGKMSIAKGNSSNDKSQSTQWKRIPSHALKTLSSFKQLYEWEAAPGQFL